MAKRYGLVIDLERCIGCHTCSIACKVENDIEEGSGIRVDTVGGPHRDTPEGKFPNLSMYYLPVLCQHCAKPPCLDSCVEGAIYRREDGIVVIDEKKCSGCQLCVQACPYGALVHLPGKNVVWKCNRCVHRVDQGLEPFCVRCCENEALFFGDLNDPGSAVSRLISRKRAHTLRPEHGTEPSTYYCDVAKPKRK